MTNRVVSNPSYAALQHCEALQQLLPKLQEPYQGALFHLSMLIKDPDFDRTLCKQAGKIVSIIAEFPLDTIPSQTQITLRGQNPLSWEEDQLSNGESTRQNIVRKRFTIHFTPELMNQEKFQFKLCLVPSQIQNQMKWSSGENYSVNLKQRGHISHLRLSGISFGN